MPKKRIPLRYVLPVSLALVCVLGVLGIVSWQLRGIALPAPGEKPTAAVTQSDEEDPFVEEQRKLAEEARKDAERYRKAAEQKRKEADSWWEWYWFK